MINSEQILNNFLHGKLTSFEELSGGLVHHVYRVTEENATYIVKIRGEEGSGLDGLCMSPGDIAYEAQGLEIFSSVLPDLFPYLLHENADFGLIAMSDVLPNGGEALQDRCIAGNLESNLVFNLGLSIGRIFSDTPSIQVFRLDDARFFKRMLEFRFGRIPIEGLLEELCIGTEGLILGGLSPKNILIDDQEQVKFCDLETVCVGIKEFDIGYSLGHIILHSDSGKNRKCFYDSYWSGLTKASGLIFDSNLVHKYAAATILYRTYKPNVPYKINGTDKSLAKLSENALYMLENGINDLNFLIN